MIKYLMDKDNNIDSKRKVLSELPITLFYALMVSAVAMAKNFSLGCPRLPITPELPDGFAKAAFSFKPADYGLPRTQLWRSGI